MRDSYDLARRLVRVEKGELAAWQSEAVAPRDWPDFIVKERVDTTYDALDRKVAEGTVDPATSRRTGRAPTPTTPRTGWHRHRAG